MRLFLPLTLFYLVPSAEAQSVSTSNPAGCLTSDYDPSVDYFPAKVQPSEATAFSVQYFNTYKIVSNHYSNVTYLLYQCGTEVPSTVDTTAFNGVLSIPIDQVGLSQTPQVPFIEQLDKLNNIAFFLTDPEFNSSPCFADRIENGDVWLLRDGQPDTGSLTNPTEVESPNGLVAFMGTFDLYINTTATPIIVSEFAETTNKAIFEWLYFYSVFFNAEELASNVVAAADAEYDCIRERTQLTATDANRPLVLWAYYSEFCSGWSIGSCPSYYCEFARDAGVDLIQVPEDFGSIVGQDSCAGENFLTIDEIIQVGQNASHWFFMAPYWDRTYEAFQEQLDTMVSVQAQTVFDYRAAGENAWFQDRLAEYYHVLHDFCATVGTCPQYVGPRWFRNVFTETIGDEGQCSDQANRFPFKFETCNVGDEEGSESPSSRPSAVVIALLAITMLLVRM